MVNVRGESHSESAQVRAGRVKDCGASLVQLRLLTNQSSGNQPPSNGSGWDNLKLWVQVHTTGPVYPSGIRF